MALQTFQHYLALQVHLEKIACIRCSGLPKILWALVLWTFFLIKKFLSFYNFTLSCYTWGLTSTIKHFFSFFTCSEYCHPIKVRNLGTIFDSTMDSEAFVNIKYKSAFYNLRDISWVWKSLTTKAVETIIQAFVTFKLDYCNCLLHGAPSSLFCRLQKL